MPGIKKKARNGNKVISILMSRWPGERCIVIKIFLDFFVVEKTVLMYE